jgi:hypothetical protein
MNRSDNSINPIEWFRFADKDWDRMKRMLETERYLSMGYIELNKEGF